MLDDANPVALAMNEVTKDAAMPNDLYVVEAATPAVEPVPTTPIDDSPPLTPLHTTNVKSSTAAPAVELVVAVVVSTEAH
mmetsp:Transcript_59796/g.71239  ORF Transcript_59796/g.71239 Transcript_59796/m.71239 type:complete len:80 (+) Transcript_59796:2-241(+)